MALSRDPGVTIRCIDVGGRLEPANQVALDRMSRSAPDEWSTEDLRTVTRIAVVAKDQRLPEKRNYGSAFPFSEFGQLGEVTGEPGTNTHVVSGAYGGFSNTWGAQTMVYSDASFSDWPFSRSALEPDYRAILNEIPYAAEEDDYNEFFPLWAPAEPLPPLSRGSQRVLDRYRRHRVSVRRHGVIVGKARLAMRGSKCVSCGLCMTGCPYSYVYSASQTFDQLIAAGKVHYTGGLVATSLGERDGRPFVTVRDTASGEVETLTADKIFVGIGSVATTRLVATSLDRFDEPMHFRESVQFVMPFVSLASNGALRQDDSFTLNQFNLLLPFDEAGRDLVQVHAYSYNDAMDLAIPGVLRMPALKGVGTQLLKHLTVGLGYLPSWWSPGFDVTFTKPSSSGQLAHVAIAAATSANESAKRLRAVNVRLLKVARQLGIAPVVPMVSMSAPGKSYHFGGSFPHSNVPTAGRESDLLGRVDPWRHIHLVDATVFPTISATTFTLTIMANAHRIARTVLEARGD